MVALLVVLVVLLGRSSAQPVPASVLADSAAYPEWAHYHWVWLASRDSNQTACLALVRDYLAHNISVGGTDIDSLWSTGVNDFAWDTAKFPNATAMVSEMHTLGVRVVLWATSLIDTDSPNFAVAKAKGYLVSKGRTVPWWHGHGAFIDYTYAPALQWWNSLLDGPLVTTGVDGFKTDGTDPYLLELDAFGGAKGHDGKHIDYRSYADMYYGGFFNHSRARNPDALIMARPVDSWDDTLYWQFQPRYSSFSGWVGDQDPTFGGLLDAMNNMLRSAWANYVSFGSDTGGYRSAASGIRTRELMLRWTQLNSLMGLFENGGENEHRPWMFAPANETTAIYRYHVELHTSLATYLLTAGTNAYESGRSLVTPVARKPLLPFDDPSVYQYWLGPNVFVDPVLAANVTVHRVYFPKGTNYVDWRNTSRVYAGGSSVHYPVALTWPALNYPVFHRQGALLVRNHITVPLPLRPSTSEPLNVLLPCPMPGQTDRTAIRRWNQPAQEVWYSFDAAGTRLELVATAHPRSLSFTVSGVRTSPATIHDAVRGRDLAPTATRLAANGELLVDDMDCSQGVRLILKW